MHRRAIHHIKGLQLNNFNIPMAPGPNLTGGPNLQAKCRGLLARDGENLSLDQLKAAQTKCLQVADRVDILLVNPPRMATSMLSGLLIMLEETGIDYRLTLSEGSLADQINHYIKRFLGIRLVIVPSLLVLGTNWRVDAANLRHQGYQIMSMMNSPMV